MERKMANDSMNDFTRQHKRSERERAEEAYPGIDWDELLKMFWASWDLEKMAEEMGEEIQERILFCLRRYRTFKVLPDGIQSREARCSNNQVRYFLARRYVVQLPDSPRYSYDKIGKELSIDTSPTSYSTTAQGEDCIATNRLHNIERTAINLTREFLLDSAKAKKQDRPLRVWS
jgi:hypothetical protein